jgi:hypothetical protein
MTENTEQYMARITGYVAGKDHMDVLGSTANKLAALVNGITTDTLTRRPVPDKWSIAEILAHLAESEMVFAYRLRLVLGNSGTEIQAFDQNVWHDNAGYLNADVPNALKLFETLRASNTALLKSLKKEQWNHYGMHQERGKETVTRIVEMFAGHDVNHTMQIEGILNGTRK